MSLKMDLNLRPNSKGQIILTEYCNKERASYLLDHIDDCVTKNIHENKYKTKEKAITFLNKVVNSANGYIKTKYHKSPDTKAGRWFVDGGLGLQYLKREYRNTLCRDYYYDVDMVNCCPSILLQLLKDSNLSCDTLKHYINNREAVLSSYNDRNEAKESIISLIYGGAIKCNMDDFMKNLKLEISEITNYLIDKNEQLYDKIKKIAKKNDKNYNIGGKLINYLVTEKENEIIEECAKFFYKNGYRVTTLIHDGILILKQDKEITDTLLDSCREHVKDRTGFDMKFICKPFTDGLEIPKQELDKYKSSSIVVNNDTEAADFVLDTLKDEIVLCNKRYFVNELNSSIYQEETEIDKFFMKKISNMNIDYVTYDLDGNKKIIKDVSKNTKNIKSIRDLSMARMSNTKNFIKDMWHTNIGKLCYKDCYYEFKDDKFKNYDGGFSSTLCIDRNKPKMKKKYIQQVYDRVLNPIFKDKEQLKYFLNWCARGLAGEYTEKTWAVGTGDRNTGKGVIGELFKETFGDYVGFFRSEELICTKVGGGDIAKRLGWTVPFEFTRLNFSNEMKITDDRGNRLKLDGNLIKSVASGGDVQTARLNYRDQIQFKIQGRMCLFANELLETSPDDADQTLTAFSFDTKFVREITEDQEKINNNDSKTNYRIADNEIKEFIRRPEIIDAFTYIVFEHYSKDILDVPECIKENKNEIVDEEDRDLVKLKEIFIFENDRKMRIDSKELHRLIDMYYPQLTKNKRRRKLETLGAVMRKSSEKFYFYNIQLRENLDDN